MIDHVNDGEEGDVKRDAHVWVNVSHTDFPEYVLSKVVDVVGSIEPTYHLEISPGTKHRKKRTEIYTSVELLEARGQILGKKLGI